MRIAEICALLRRELYDTGYQYGFYSNEKRFTPDIKNGFDAEFFHLSRTIYRIQNPVDTMREKVGTCIDTVMVMKTILDNLDVPYKIWLIYHREKKREHTILTFAAEDKIIYLELTPQSSKPWYGKEILYDNEQHFIKQFQKENYIIVEITDKIIIGDAPDSLLRCLDLS